MRTFTFKQANLFLILILTVLLRLTLALPATERTSPEPSAQGAGHTGQTPFSANESQTLRETHGWHAQALIREAGIDLLQTSISELQEGMDKGDFTSEDLVRAYLGEQHFFILLSCEDQTPRTIPMTIVHVQQISMTTITKA